MRAIVPLVRTKKLAPWLLPPHLAALAAPHDAEPANAQTTSKNTNCSRCCSAQSATWHRWLVRQFLVSGLALGYGMRSVAHCGTHSRNNEVSRMQGEALRLNAVI